MSPSPPPPTAADAADQEPSPPFPDSKPSPSNPSGTDPIDDVEEEDPEEEEVLEGDTADGDDDMEEEVEEVEEVVPEPVQRKRKMREYEVFVGGLPREATEEDLTNAFKKAGDVVEIRLVKSQVTNMNKGFAFIRFGTIEEAKKAVALDLIKVKGKTCGVLRSNDNETLHLGNICRTWTKDDLIEKLKAFELENLEEVHLVEDLNNGENNRGYAFLEFGTHMDAVAALSKLQKKVIFFGVDVRAEVTFSRTVEPDEEAMSQVRSVFLDGLPVTWDEPQVQEHFKKFGEIESVQLARYMPTAKRKNFGFVCFTTRQAALDCIEVVNRDGISEGSGKVLLKATLKKPLLKRTPMLGVRRGFTGKDFGTRRPQPYVSARSYPGRPGESHGFVGKPRGPGRFSSRGRAVVSPPMRNYGARLRTDFQRDIPVHTSSRFRDPVDGSSRSTDPYAQSSRYREPYMQSSRPREPYMQSSRPRDSYVQRNIPSHGRAVGSYPDDTYSQRRGQHPDDIYDIPFEPSVTYEYPAESGYRRPYSDLEHDIPPNSLMRRVRSRLGVETNAYPRIRDPEYDEYSRFPQDEYYDYGRTEFGGDGGDGEHGGRYFSRNGASSGYY